MRATCPAHHILFDLITPIILVKRTSYEAPHYAVFSSLLPLPPLGPNILISTLFSVGMLNCCFVEENTQFSSLQKVHCMNCAEFSFLSFAFHAEWKM
jgi:hypothetical protein